jgi:predicted O-linked N-acetylglucosamine transferase (SPINDLY family)
MTLNLPEVVQRAIAAYGRGAWSEAEMLCRQVLDAKSDYFDALNLLGIIAAQTRRTQEAADLLGRAVAANPASAATHNNLGNVRQELARLDEALDSYDRALRIKPDFAEACSNRGNTLRKLKRPVDALACYERALALKPDYAEAHNHRGDTLQELKRPDDALASYEHAIRFRPGYAEAYNNRGNALREVRRLEEALASYEQAIELKPDYVEAHNNRGVTQLELKRFDAALASYERAIALKPDAAEAHNNRGQVLRRLQRYSDAAQAFARVLELAPAYSFAQGNLLHAKMLCCDWTDLGALYESTRRDSLLRKPAASPFGYQAFCDSEQELRICAEVYAAETFPKQDIQICAGKRSRAGKIRIGYVSGEFREHATAILMAGLFELHDRNRFEIFAFDNGGGDGSEIRARIDSAFSEIVDIRRMSDASAASLVNRKGIDILVNLNGYFGELRQGIFCYRPSPVQVNYLGFPGTMGAEYFDYLIADGTLIPDASRQHYSEKIAYLPGCYQVNDRRRAAAGPPPSREELGLPRAGFVFCCFNNNYKITPGTFDGWMRILEQVDGSVLWLLEDNPAAARNLCKEAAGRGVRPDRLIFARRMPLPAHLARHRAADLFIDTLPYNAHTTASDALWAGLPLLTCAGRTFAGRVAASLLKAVDLPELITTTQEQYEALAVALATNPLRLDQIRQVLERNRLTAPLFDTRLFARRIEDAYAQMYERYQADLPPDHLYASP